MSRPALLESLSTTAQKAGAHQALGLRLELALLGGVLLAGLALRLPHLAMVPQLTDESNQILLGLAIYRGEAWPLVNQDSYQGALFNYLVALAFLPFGPSAEAARAVVLAGGALTVLATYLLGRAWAGPRGGVLAAGLLAVNGPHVVVNSHVAWGNCLTPLFTTLAIWSLYRGVGGPRGERTHPAHLVASGFWWGLAIQTHPAVAAFFPALGVYLLWKGRQLLLTRWPYLAAAAFLLGSLNLVTYNLQTGFESLHSADDVRENYATDERAADTYLAGLGMELLLTARVLAGMADTRPVAGYLADPALILVVGLTLAGLLQQARRGNHLPWLLAVSYLLLLPVFNQKFVTLLTTRYVVPLAPIAFAAVGGLLVAGLSRLNSRPAWSRWAGLADRRRRGLAAGGAALAAGILLLAPLPTLARYYEKAYETGETNERVYVFADLVRRHYRTGETLVLDQAFGSEAGGGASELRALRFLVAFDDVPTRVLKLTPKRLEAELDDAPSVLTILSGRLLRDFDRLPLQPLTPVPEHGSEYGLFRISEKGPPPENR